MPPSLAREQRAEYIDAVKVDSKLCAIMAELLKDGKIAPGSQNSSFTRGVAQLNPRNHCGELAEDFLDKLLPFLTNFKSRSSFVTYLEVLTDSDRNNHDNHARVLIGMPGKIVCVDPWKNEIKDYLVHKNGRLIIPDEFGSTNLYRLDPVTSEISAEKGSNSKLEKRFCSMYDRPKTNRKIDIKPNSNR